MNKILNYLFTFLKCILLLASFGLITYITLFMYRDIGKNLSSNLMEFILLLLPYIILVFIYMYTLVGKEKNIIQNLFFNVVNFVSLLSIFIICLRTVVDKNIIEYYNHGVNINYNYFNDYIAFFTIMIYGLIIGHILLIIKGKLNNKKEHVDINQNVTQNVAVNQNQN